MIHRDILIKIAMARKFKFVTVVLAVLIFVGSVPISARCDRSQQSERREHCAPDCPMMAHAGVPADTSFNLQSALNSIPERTNCCTISNSRPETVAQLQVPTTVTADLAPSTTDSVALVIAVAGTSPVVQESCYSASLSSAFVLRI